MQQGFFSVQQTCPQCRGQGSVITDPCVSCNGRGLVRDEKTLSVKIPGGVDEGDQVRLGGEGESNAPGVSPGDLYVQVRIIPHQIFERDGDNLYCEMPVDFVTMALGGTIEIPTLSGRANLKVPTESQSEKSIPLAREGGAQCTQRQPGRPVLQGGGRNPGQPDRETKRPGQGIRQEHFRRRQPPRAAKQFMA